MSAAPSRKAVAAAPKDDRGLPALLARLRELRARVDGALTPWVHAWCVTLTQMRRRSIRRTRMETSTGAFCSVCFPGCGRCSLTHESGRASCVALMRGVDLGTRMQIHAHA